MTNKTIEVCKNLLRTIDNLEGNSTTGDSILRDNSPWSAVRPTKSALRKKLEYIMKKNNITYDQIR
tara:strand:- start:1073 stop:1270 length:198 start_codon:yes stop_codon:yes gene_type:complete